MGWLKKAITHHLSLNTISYLENYRYPDEPIYHFIPPTGLVSDVAVAASRPVYGPGRFKLHLIRGIVNIYKLSQAQKDPYNLERCTRCIYTFYKGIFPGLATAGRSWLGRSKSLWSLCESIINKRMASLIKVEKYDVAAAFFDNAQLFMDTYLFRLYCTAEGDEMLLEYLRNQRDEITLTTLKVIAAASHANDLVAPGEQALFELFIKNNRLPEEKKRVAREYLVHGIGIQKIEVEDPGSWALRKFLLELDLPKAILHIAQKDSAAYTFPIRPGQGALYLAASRLGIKSDITMEPINVAMMTENETTIGICTSNISSSILAPIKIKMNESPFCNK